MDSYNSQYPLEYYEVGTPYMFYHSNIANHGSAATMENIKQYGSVLKKTESQKGSGYCFAKRVIGVVVAKEMLNEKNGAITVMFQGIVGGKPAYMTTKYITNLAGGSFCDDKEQFDAAGVIDLTGEINVTIAGGKGGGIALEGGKGGGIALEGGNTKGGIALG